LFSQAGTFRRIEAVLREEEDRTDFVREAVECELQRVSGAESDRDHIVLD